MEKKKKEEEKRTFSGQLVKETSTSKVFKLSHKSAAFGQIEQNGPPLSEASVTVHVSPGYKGGGGRS